MAQHHAFKAVLWDNDGVLVDSESEFFALTQRVFAEEGLALSAGVWAHAFLGKGLRTWEIANGLGMEASQAESLAEKRDELWRARLLTPISAVQGVEETLQRLTGRIRMAVVTGAPRMHFEGVHRHLDLLCHFEFAITYDECPAVKPLPDAYLLAAQRMHLDPGECLAVEDSPRGLRAARAAGMPCAVLATPLTEMTQCGEADWVIQSIPEVLRVLTTRT